MDSNYRSRSGISAAGRSELTAVMGRGRRFVGVDETAIALNVDPKTSAKKLARWAEQGWLRRVRRGLYIAVPVDAEDPKAWSEDALVIATAVWSPCYFTGWTAANHWGLTEQVFRTTVLKTTGRVRTSTVLLLGHEYMVTHVKKPLMEWGIESFWHDERRLQIADPARTVIDILDTPRLGGGIRHVGEILGAYLNEHDPDRLVTYGDRLGNATVFKRLGYLLEAAGRGEPGLLAACRTRLSSGISLLDPDGPRGGVRSAAWALRANVRVDAEDPS